ncbi:MAG: N-6 DNA methylase, partial [Gemmatimonadales bacterium]
EVDAIAPDMLGRVFERLMRPAERAKTGTFYTPESVVHGIVERAVTAALPAMGVSTGTVEQLVQGEPVGMRERQIAGSALRRLRILDPAVGSGAFLLGALHLLTEIGRSLEPPKEECAPWRIRRRVLRENLFGVDLNPLAVRLSELRLWLAVVADDPTTDIARISPLPNLDGVVRQGNTLLDPIGTTRVHHTGFSPPAVHATRQVRSARERVFETRGRDATRALGALRAAEVKLAQATLEHADRVVCHALQELNSIERGRDLFGRRTRLSPSQRSARRSLEQDRTSLRHALTVLRDGTIPFFSFEVHAPEVMAAGGFHVVVGNPPWVRAERLSPDERAVLRRRFSWWRARTERGFAHLPDLALAFLERALELTAPGGTVGFLLPSKVTSAAYGHTARQHLVRETTITYLHRIPDREAQQFGATTYPLALVLRNEPPSPGHTVPLDSAGQDGVAQAALAHSGPWILVPDRARDAIEQLRASGTPLREVAAPALGVKTGADQVLTGTLQYESDGIAHVQFGESRVDIESAVLRPALRGRDVLPFDARPSRVVLWGLDGGGRPTSRLPERAANHVSRYRERLCARTDYRGGPSWTLFRTRTALAKHRVVWRDIARRPCAVTLEHTVAADAIPLNSCYVAGFPDDASALAATAVLNSTWAAVLAAATADEARGGYRRINARVIGEIPVVTTGPACASLATLSAAYHRSHHAPRGALDEAVAQALGLPGSVQECLRTLGARNGR